MKKDYSELLKDPRWQKKRLQILQRDKFKCKLCGDEKATLHVHHKEYINGYAPWEYDNKSLITLCEDCHFQIEALKKDDSNFDFNEVKIYKSIGWTDNSKILFIAYAGYCTMWIYDKNNQQLCNGYHMSIEEIKNIINILKKA